MATIGKLQHAPLVLEGTTPGTNSNAVFTVRPGPMPPGLTAGSFSVSGPEGMLVEVTVTTTQRCTIRIWDSSTNVLLDFPNEMSRSMLFKFSTSSLKFQFLEQPNQVPFYVKIQPL